MRDNLGFRYDPAAQRHAADRDISWVVLAAAVLLFDVMALAGWFR